MLSRLYTLLLVLVVAWSSWAFFGPVSVIVCAIVFLFAAVLAARPWTGFLPVILGLLLLGAILMQAVNSCQQVVRWRQCTNNLRQIGIALLNYESGNGSFPPAYVADKNGKPMHSWRALIWKYVYENSMANPYNFKEPWDGPYNRKSVDRRPDIFACPGDDLASSQSSTTTSYVAVVGAGRRGDKPLKLADLEGKLSSTILLVEVADAGINWTEPKDLSLDALQAGKTSSASVTVSSKHMCDHGLFSYSVPAGANVLMADGSVRFLPAADLTADKLPKLLSIGGCKDEDATGRQLELRFIGRKVAALAIWLVSVGLLLHRAERSRKARQKVANSCT